MKKKSSLIIILIVLIVIIAGASFAYKHLAKKDGAQNLVANGETVDNDAIDDTNTESSDNITDTATGNDTSAEDGSTASETPDFTVVDKDGNAIKLSDFQGKPVILNFWASWCGPCQAEMPDFDEMYAEYGDEIHFVMVNVTDGSRETVDSAKAFIEDTGYSFPVYFDTELEASMTFGAYSIPTTYFLDAAGQPIAQATGTINKDIMQQGIDMIYSK